MSRSTNQELCTAFRELLTTRFKIIAPDTADNLCKHVDSDTDADDVLDATKSWRGDLWKAFREIEQRLCPQPPERQQS